VPQVGRRFVIFDVFESQQAFEDLTEVVGPIARSVGIQEPPKAFQIHTDSAA
jgi:hypothetical protein